MRTDARIIMTWRGFVLFGVVFLAPFAALAEDAIAPVSPRPDCRAAVMLVRAPIARWFERDRKQLWFECPDIEAAFDVDSARATPLKNARKACEKKGDKCLFVRVKYDVSRLSGPQGPALHHATFDEYCAYPAKLPRQGALKCWDVQFTFRAGRWELNAISSPRIIDYQTP